MLNIAVDDHWHDLLSFLVHMDQRSMGTIAITLRPSSVNFSHFKLLLRYHWANWNQTYQVCSLDGPLQSFCFSFQLDIQHGWQGQWYALIGWNFKDPLFFKLLNWLNPNFKWTIIGMSFTKFLFLCRLEIQDGHHHRT
jgi:hypothetical protein